MSQPLSALLFSALTLAVAHTVVSLDHVVPFVALGRVRAWSRRKTLAMTAAAGLVHVAASAVLGLLVLGAGLAASRVTELQALRELAGGWLLVGGGVAYAVWAAWRGRRAALTQPGAERTVGGMLFVFFALGPCESLVPLMLHPSVAHDGASLALVVSLFAVATVGTMVALVAAARAWLPRPSFAWLSRHAHVAAGVSVALAGLAAQLVG